MIKRIIFDTPKGQFEVECEPNFHEFAKRVLGVEDRELTEAELKSVFMKAIQGAVS